MEVLVRVLCLGLFIGVFYGNGKFSGDCERTGWQSWK
jgi:hypothetical protein